MNYITVLKIQVFLHQFGCLSSLKECSILFYKPEFKYVDFLRFLLPTNQLLRDQITCLDQQSQQSNECLKEVAKHIKQEIVQMNNLPPPQSLDKLTNGTREEIESLFKNQNLFVYQDEIKAMIKRLDFYGDGQIDLLLLKFGYLSQIKKIKLNKNNHILHLLLQRNKYSNSIKTQRQKSQKKVTSCQTQKKIQGDKWVRKLKS